MVDLFILKNPKPSTIVIFNIYVRRAE